MNTPWGASDSHKEYAPGIVFYTTPGHGGFHLSPQRLAEMPEGLRSFQPWAGEGWYEEDCDWAIVVSAFPDHFVQKTRDAAAQTLKSSADYFAKNGAVLPTAEPQAV